MFAKLRDKLIMKNENYLKKDDRLLPRGALLSSKQMEQIHEASVKLLITTGFQCKSDDVLEMFAEAGAKVNGKHVILTKEIIKKALDTVPSKFKIAGRDPEQILELEPGGNTYTRTVGGPDFILDHKTNCRRPVVINDTKQYIRLAQALDNIHVIKPIYANDLPMNTRDIQIFEHMLNLSNKALCIAPISKKNMEWIIELASLAVGGKEQIKKCPPVYFMTSMNSPLVYDKGQVEVLANAGKYGIPVILNNMPMTGLTGPITLAGTLTLTNAEMLAGIVISQISCSGAPIFYGGKPLVIDLRYTHCITGGAESGLLWGSITQLGQKFYNIPTDTLAMCCDSKLNDFQAGAEKIFSTWMQYLGGSNVIAGAGSMESAATASFVQLVLDNEIHGILNRAMRGIKVDFDIIAADVISKVGTGQNFLLEDHTIRHMRSEYYTPSIFSQDPRQHWQANGSKDIVTVAKEKVEMLLAASFKPMDTDLAKELKNVTQKAVEDIA